MLLLFLLFYYSERLCGQERPLALELKTGRGQNLSSVTNWMHDLCKQPHTLLSAVSSLKWESIVKKKEKKKRQLGNLNINY